MLRRKVFPVKVGSLTVLELLKNGATGNSRYPKNLFEHQIRNVTPFATVFRKVIFADSSGVRCQANCDIPRHSQTTSDVTEKEVVSSI